jgi:hypothetical protein
VEIARDYQDKENRKRVKSRIRAEARKIDIEGELRSALTKAIE